MKNLIHSAVNSANTLAANLRNAAQDNSSLLVIAGAVAFLVIGALSASLGTHPAFGL